MVLHAGDLDYRNHPELFEAQVDRYLGPNFPYFYAPGDHDTQAWYPKLGYQHRLERRLNLTGALCDGTQCYMSGGGGGAPKVQPQCGRPSAALSLGH